MMEEIQVTVNKKKCRVPREATVSELLVQRGMAKAAVWINGRQLLRAEYGETIPQEGDEIKILRILAGG